MWYCLKIFSFCPTVCGLDDHFYDTLIVITIKCREKEVAIITWEWHVG